MALVQAVGNDNGAGATTLTVSLGAVTAGNLLGICVGVQSRRVTGVSDSVNGAWTEAFAQTNQYAAPGLWYFANTGAGTPTVTVTFSESNASAAIAFEESGVLTSSPMDKEAHSSTTSSAAWNSGTTATTAQANEVAFGFVSSGDGSNRSFAADAGWTALTGTGITSGHHGNATDGNDVFVARREYTSTGTYSATGTCTSGNWCAAIVTFKQSASSAFNPLNGQRFQPL